jgi:hypothetical protein
MSILVEENARLIRQGITGKAGKFQAEQPPWSCSRRHARAFPANTWEGGGIHDDPLCYDLGQPSIEMHCSLRMGPLAFIEPMGRNLIH